MQNNISINKRDPLLLQSGSGMVYGQPSPARASEISYGNDYVGMSTANFGGGNNFNNDYQNAGEASIQNSSA